MKKENGRKGNLFEDFTLPSDGGPDEFSIESILAAYGKVSAPEPGEKPAPPVKEVPAQEAKAQAVPAQETKQETKIEAASQKAAPPANGAGAVSPPSKEAETQAVPEKAAPPVPPTESELAPAKTDPGGFPRGKNLSAPTAQAGEIRLPSALSDAAAQKPGPEKGPDGPADSGEDFRPAVLPELRGASEPPASAAPRIFSVSGLRSQAAGPETPAAGAGTDGEDESADAAEDNVLDLKVFDEAYERKQRSIKNLKTRLIRNAKKSKKTQSKYLTDRNIGYLVPATLKTAPIPIPAEIRRAGAGTADPEAPSAPEKKAPPKPPKPLNPVSMLKRFGMLKKSFALRFAFAAVFTLPLLYIALAPELGWYLPDMLSFAENPFNNTVVSLVLLLAVIGFGFDIFFGGLADIILLKPGGDSLVFLSATAALGHCVYSLFDSSALFDASGNPFFAPIAALPAAAIVFSLLGDRLSTKSYYRSLQSGYRLARTRVIAPLPEKLDGGTVYAVGGCESPQGFYRSMCENDSATQLLRWYSPAAIVIALALTFYCVYSGGGDIPFFWCLSVISAFLPALGFFLSSGLPLSRAAKRMFKSGVLLGGGKALERLGEQSFVLLEDSDLFPCDAITVAGFKLIRPDAKKLAISMTASLLDASHSSLARPFVRLASDNFAPILPVSNLSIHDSGGISGKISGHNIMVGTGGYMQRQGVPVSPDIKLRTAVFCAVDTELVAVFAVKYQVSPRSDYCMGLLHDNGYTPVVAARDFNVTAAFIQTKFGIPSSEIVYPSAELRVSLSDPSRLLESDGALIPRGGGEAMAEALIACRRYRTASRASLIFSLISSLLGLGIGALIVFQSWGDAATAGNMLAYYFMWLLPVFLFSGWVNRF